MKRILLFLFVLVATFAAKAADDKSLFIKFYDGSKMEFVMSANPEISMANDVMTITSNGTTSQVISSMYDSSRANLNVHCLSTCFLSAPSF